MIDPNFSNKNIVFNVSDFVDLLEKAEAGQLPKGSAVLFEEMGVAADSRSWHSEDNIKLSHILQTFRPMNLCVLNTVPELSLADKRISQLASCLIECKRINYTTKRCAVRIYDPVRFDGKTSQWFKRSVAFSRMSANGYYRTYKFGDVWVHKPSVKALREYEKVRSLFSKDVLAGRTKTLGGDAEPTTKRVQLTADRLDEYVSKIILDQEKFMRVEPGVGITKFNLSSVQSEFADDQLGLSNAKVIKAATRKRMVELGFNVKF
jgi:hypothetical protein